MRNLMIAVLVCLAVSPCFASQSLQVYGSGPKIASLCASLQMYEDVTISGVLDVNRTGWFTRIKVTEGKGNLLLAQELRASSSGMRVYAISPQWTVKDSTGSFTANTWYDTEHSWVVSISQSHKLTDRIWTYSWTDFFSHKEAKGTIRVGYKENAHLDTFAEYRFNTQTRDNGIFAGISLH